jgi:hypothetical protein
MNLQEVFLLCHDRNYCKGLYLTIIYKNTFLEDGFYSLTCGAINLTEYGDVYIEDYLPHMHYDWSENTSSSTGVNLYYWNDKINE